MSDIANPTTPVTVYCGENPAESAAITKTVDGAKNRMDVNALIEGGVTITSDESPTKFQLKTDFDATGDTVTSGADVTLFSYTGDGLIDFIALACGGSGYIAIVEIDGTERLRIGMNELGSDIGLANGTGVPVWVETANKNFRFVPQNGVGFTTGFVVKARATGADVTIKHFTMYREKVA